MGLLLSEVFLAAAWLLVRPSSWWRQPSAQLASATRPTDFLGLFDVEGHKRRLTLRKSESQLKLQLPHPTSGSETV